jgi:anthranilate phosphoribosyltransferase
MQQYLKEIGRGKKGAADLTYDDAWTAAEKIFDGEASEAQIGAFLIAERVKGETPDELRAFIASLRLRSFRLEAHDEFAVLDVAGPYDGRAKSYAATVPASMITAAAGQPVFLHGVASLPPKHGVTIPEICEALRVPLCKTADQVARLLRAVGIALGDTESLCPPLAKLRPIRIDLGVRTLLNTAEKFLDLARARFSLSGVFHTGALEKAAELVSRLGYQRALVVQGVDGSEDVPAHRPSAVYLYDHGKLEKFVVKPDDYGLKTDGLPVPETAAEHARWTEAVLDGEPHPARSMVVLNAALRLWLAEKVRSVEEGVAMAAALLDQGAAKKILEQWRISG